MATRIEPLEYRHGATRLVGQLAWDDARGDRRPGVLIYHEAGGLGDHVKYRARLLAELGYIALACDVFGDGVHADRERTQPLFMALRADRVVLRERALSGLAALRAQPLVDPTRIAAIGFCFGGTTVLEMGRAGHELAGVVSFHGALDTPLPAEPNTVKARMLVCHGALDPFVTWQHVTAFVDEMKHARCDYRLTIYSGAVHGFTNRDADKQGISGLAYDAETDARSWAAMQAFFGEVFAQPLSG
jgi:dienelactone hydrolase